MVTGVRFPSLGLAVCTGVVGVTTTGAVDPAPTEIVVDDDEPAEPLVWAESGASHARKPNAQIEVFMIKV